MGYNPHGHDTCQPAWKDGVNTKYDMTCKYYKLLPPSHNNCHFTHFSFSQNNCHFRIPHLLFFSIIIPLFIEFHPT